MDLLGGVAPDIQAALDLGVERQKAIAANMANVNTPGYRAKDVRFDAALGRAVEVEREGMVAREDGNNVVLEVETAALRKNALAYQVFLAALQQQVRTAKAAVSGRGG